MNTRAFSLVELSIVLVILGLLTGGILAGQSLIRAAELRGVITDYQKHVAATQAFRDKYLAYPGDFRDATRFWTRTVNAAHCATNSAAAVSTPGTCDGNGNGTIDTTPAASQSGEEFQFWRHLGLAGMIEGSYTGLAGPTADDDLTISGNVPAGKLSNSVWRIYNYGSPPVASAFNISGTYGAVLHGGINDIGIGMLRAEEIWNIDTKLDDGKPAQGKLILRPWSGCSDAANNNDLAAEYALTSTASGCMPLFPRFIN